MIINILVGMNEGIVSILIEILGPEKVLTGNDLAERYDHIWRMDQPLRAKTLVFPESTDEVSAIASACHSCGQIMVIHGGLTNLVGSTRTEGHEVVVSLDKMNRIRELDPVSRTITCEAGVILESIHEAADKEDLFFPLNFGAKGSARIGGIIASNAGGLRVLRYGMTRAHVLGLEVVLPDGTIINSMKKIIKDNSGYDIKQMFIGAEGTLGIITSAVLSLLEKPTSRQSAFLALDSYQKVTGLLKFMDKHLAGLLSGFELIWGDSYRKMTSTTSHTGPPLPPDHKYYVLLETLGIDHQADFNRLQDLLEQCLEKGLIEDGVMAYNQSDLDWFWNIREDVHVLAKASAHDQHFDVSLPIPDIGQYADAVKEELLLVDGVEYVFTFGHIADGNIHFIVGKTNNDEKLRNEINDIVYAPLTDLGGSVSAEHGIGIDKKPYLHLCRKEEEINLMKQLKKALDPKNIMNPGRIFNP